MKYHFEVVFTDGTTYKQTKEDISKTNPKKNCFYDVLHSKKQIRRFTLSKLFESWSVDLSLGTFYHNGTRIQVEENPLPRKRELIYFVQHQRDFNVTSKKEITHRATYFIGWKIGDKQQIIGIK
jgi:hypothetical protein